MIRKVADLLSQFQCSKAQKHLQSSGLGDHNDETIVQPMTRKYSKQKTPITPITDAELQVVRETIDMEVLSEHLHLLKHDSAPSRGCTWNEHPLAL